MILDGHVPPLAVAGFAQTLAERDLTLWGRSNADVADHRQRSLLGAHRKRPRRRAAEPCEEIAPSKAKPHLPLPVRRGRIARPEPVSPLSWKGAGARGSFGASPRPGNTVLNP